MNRSRQGIRARSREGAPQYERRKRDIPVKRTVFVQGDGKETEFQYFMGLRQHPVVKSLVKLTTRPGVGRLPITAVTRVIDRLEGRREVYDELYCVVDTEGNAESEDLQEAGVLAAKHNIELIRSHPSFEVWLLAHFDKDARIALNWQEAKDLLNPHWQKRMGREYDKADSAVRTGLADLTHQAIANARGIYQRVFNSDEVLSDDTCWTEVYKLVAHLLGFPDTEA